ncbi:MAG: hypothetical protein HQL52_03755 [Magnetococcales bacterium]|nr:hypothetical protein [Magnetococcales bacterium]
MRWLALIFFVFLSLPADAARLHHEAWYQERWCQEMGGEAEVRLADRTRVDCLTDEYAVEADFAGKLYQAVGQSLHYAKMTGKKPGILLILEKPGKEQKYLDRLMGIIGYHGLGIRVWQVSP